MFKVKIIQRRIFQIEIEMKKNMEMMIDFVYSCSNERTSSAMYGNEIAEMEKIYLNSNIIIIALALALN